MKIYLFSGAMKSTKHLLRAGPWAKEERDGSDLVLRRVADGGREQGHKFAHKVQCGLAQ